MAGSSPIFDSQKDRRKQRRLSPFLLLLFCLLLGGCRENSQKDAWIVQAILQQGEAQGVRVGLLCRTIRASEEESGLVLLTAQGQDEGEALTNLRRQESGEFYFGHCELLLLRQGQGQPWLDRAGEFWSAPEQGCGNLRVYEWQAQPSLFEAKEEAWQTFLSCVEKEEAQDGFKAYAYTLGGRQSTALLPLLEWDGEKETLKTKGVHFYREGAEQPQLWQGNQTGLAALLAGQTNSLLWQSGGGAEVLLEPALITCKVEPAAGESLTIYLDAFSRAKSGAPQQSDTLREEVEKGLEELVSTTWQPGGDVFSFQKWFAFANSAQAQQAGEGLYQKELRVHVRLWE